MACASLASLTQTIEKIRDHCSIASHHNHQIRSISEQLIFLKQLANDSPEKANFLETRLRYVAYEAKGAIENFISKNRRRFRWNKFIAKFGESKTNLDQQLQTIKEVIDSVMWEGMEMEANANTIEDYLQLSDSPSTSSSFTIAETSKIKDMNSISKKKRDMDMDSGMGDDKVAIKSQLCGGSPKLQLIPIVGMGGIGKTTLARNVYNDPLTIHYFDIRAWVTVSQDYSPQKIVSSLVESMKEFVNKKSGQSNEEVVYKSLKGRRYLIVMDDMWSTNVLDDARNLFPDDQNGSRIMLTTRLSDVAAYPDSNGPVHEMRFMSIEQSWDLLRQKVFVDEDCPPELENIGMEIARSCRGLPLAIVVIAGLLSTVEKNPDSWWEIAKNVSSIVVTEDGQFDEILSLSYTHLPHHLRPCFLYMGGFPEDHEIRVSKLVKLWVADGFLRHSSKSLEEEAEECLEDLVKRNLVLISKRKFNGKIKSCSLHDLIRDLCIRKAQENIFFLNLVDRYVEKERFIEIIQDQPRISVKSSMLNYLSNTYCPTVHTLMCFGAIHMSRLWSQEIHVLESVPLLRVLDAENADAKSLPHEIFKLFHLRYLAIRNKFDVMIPAAISKLQNLQTLIIDAENREQLIGRPSVNCLPQEIWTMSQLRHLICYGRFPYPEETASTLENLQTLSLVLHDMCVEGILEMIPNIKKLGLDCSYYDNGTHLNNLAYLHQLECIELRNADWRKDSVSFPRMLKKLTLCNMSLPWSEMSIVGSLPNLQVLKLKTLACIGNKWETSEGEFPQLQFLLIETSKLQHWITESNHFPRLKFLLLHDCGYLNEVPEGIGEITTLELIDVRGRNPVLKSLAESVKRIQEEQESLGNDALQVHCPFPK